MTSGNLIFYSKTGLQCLLTPSQLTSIAYKSAISLVWVIWICLCLNIISYSFIDAPLTILLIWLSQNIKETESINIISLTFFYACNQSLIVPPRVFQSRNFEAKNSSVGFHFKTITITFVYRTLFSIPTQIFFFSFPHL